MNDAFEQPLGFGGGEGSLAREERLHFRFCPTVMTDLVIGPPRTCRLTERRRICFSPKSTLLYEELGPRAILNSLLRHNPRLFRKVRINKHVWNVLAQLTCLEVAVPKTLIKIRLDEDIMAEF